MIYNAAFSTEQRISGSRFQTREQRLSGLYHMKADDDVGFPSGFATRDALCAMLHEVGQISHENDKWLHGINVCSYHEYFLVMRGNLLFAQILGPGKDNNLERHV